MPDFPCPNLILDSLEFGVCSLVTPEHSGVTTSFGSVRPSAALKFWYAHPVLRKADYRHHAPPNTQVEVQLSGTPRLIQRTASRQNPHADRSNPKLACLHSPRIFGNVVRQPMQPHQHLGVSLWSSFQKGDIF